MLDIGLSAALVTDIRKLEDAADILAELRRAEVEPNKKVILDIAVKLIREESDKRVLELVEIIKENGRHTSVSSVGTGIKEEVPSYPKEVITETDGA